VRRGSENDSPVPSHCLLSNLTNASLECYASASLWGSIDTTIAETASDLFCQEVRNY